MSRKRDLTRRLVDKSGNVYFVSIPFDVNADSIEDILLGMHQGIVKLQGYRLVSDGVYRLADTTETDGRQFTFHRKMMVFDLFPGLDQKDFSDAISEVLERARNQRINRVAVSTWEGKPILKDHKGSYIAWQVNCHACDKVIKGRRPISFSDGMPSRAQMFVADDPKVTQYKPGSKYRLCADCSVKSLTPEEAGIQVPEPTPVRVQELVPVISEIEQHTPLIGKDRQTITMDMNMLTQVLDMAKADSTVSPEYFRGFVCGVFQAKLIPED